MKLHRSFFRRIQARHNGLTNDLSHVSALGLLLISMLIPTSQVVSAQPALSWTQLPDLPDTVGVAGPFAGVSAGCLVVAGGANFPTGMPWEGGKKAWHDTVYALATPEGIWQKAGKLPRPLAYGVSASFSGALVCVGGSDADRHYADAFMVKLERGLVATKPLPPAPLPVAYACAALVDRTLYVAGGTEKPDSTECLKTFWALDLSSGKLEWRELPPWPGPARMLAVAGAHDGAFYLFSGVELSGEAQGKPVRRYLQDAYRFKPQGGWTQLADLPRATAGAPSPAIDWDGKLLIISGDDGLQANFEPKSEHPGFSKEAVSYNPRRKEWSSWGETPLSRATVPLVLWQGRAVIPNGEARPGVRTPEVWSLTLP